MWRKRRKHEVKDAPTRSQAKTAGIKGAGLGVARPQAKAYRCPCTVRSREQKLLAG